MHYGQNCHHVVTLFGRPFSGKGKQNERLMQTKHFHLVEVGAIKRKKMFNDPEFRRAAEKYGAGLLPDHLIMPPVFEEIQKVTHGKKLLLDGVPRVESQLHLLLDFLRGAKKPLTTIYLDVSRDVCWERAQSRSRLGREVEDCDPVVFNKRQDEFEKLTEPMIPFLRTLSFGSFHHVMVRDKFVSAEQVERQVKTALGFIKPSRFHHQTYRGRRHRIRTFAPAI